MLAYPDAVRATPRNEYLGALADLVAKSYSPVRTQQMQGTARFLSMPAISQTLDRLSYGEPLTTGSGGLGGTTRVRPEALEAGMAVAPMAQPVTMASLQAARAARQAALQAGRAGERYAERVVPEILNRGGMPAQMLQDLAQGTRSQVFIGSKSKAWDKSAAEMAKDLEKKGEAPETIWQATGTFKSPDGKWRQEVSDQNMQLRTGSYGKDIRGNPINYQVTEGNASQVLAHPELYNAYPFLKKVNTEIGIRPKTAGSAEYGDEGRFIEAFGPTDDEIKSALIHEMQHQIQNREGMASGAGFMAGDEKGFQNYLRAAGEAEARAVQARRNMSMQERRNLFPLASYDVPINQLNTRLPQKEDFGFSKSLLDVWHGSPHKLPPTPKNPLGEFDASKIGTGEGSQAYGHGIYTAENPLVSGTYQRVGAEQARVTGGMTPDVEFAYDLLSKGMDVPKVVDNFAYKYGTNMDFDNVMGAIQKAEQHMKEGYLYKVDLPDEQIAKMLDYDKTWKQQPKNVQDAINIDGLLKYYGTDDLSTSQVLYHANQNMSPAAFAEFLRSKGVPGIKYLDEGSRVEGKGTRNFVVFPGEEKSMTILERNGESVNALVKNKKP